MMFGLFGKLRYDKLDLLVFGIPCAEMLYIQLLAFSEL